jgi:hypothetical protein
MFTPSFGFYYNKKLLKENSHPKGGNSPNLVILSQDRIYLCMYVHTHMYKFVQFHLQKDNKSKAFGNVISNFETYVMLQLREEKCRPMLFFNLSFLLHTIGVIVENCGSRAHVPVDLLISISKVLFISPS